jgi:hypothetical protein
MEPTSVPPSLGHYAAPLAYKDDLELLDRYQAFSSEILRIALLGLSGLGVLVTSLLIVAKKGATDVVREVPNGAKHWVMVSALTFGIAAAAALLHRYCSTNSMACHLRILRLELEGSKPSALRKEKTKRRIMLSGSTFFIAVAPLGLACAGMAFAKALSILIYSSNYYH